MNKFINQNSVLDQKIRKTNKGFTLIETLVAISILMIAISGPLVVANKSLTAALYAKDQTTASYLAQEIIENIRNDKDNSNLEKNNSSSWYWVNLDDCKISNPCILSNHAGSGSRLAFDLLDPRFELSYYYTYISNDEEAVTAIVTWTEKTVHNSLSITTNMTRARFVGNNGGGN